MTWQVNSWLDALAGFAIDNGFQHVDVGRRSDDQDLPPDTIIFSEVRGLQSANMGLGNDVVGPYANLYVRGVLGDYQGPRDTVWALTRALWRLGGRTVHGYSFIMVGGDAAPTPSPLGRDDAGRFAWTVDVPVWMLVPTGADVVVNP